MRRGSLKTIESNKRSFHCSTHRPQLRLLKLPHYAQDPNFSMSSNRFSAAWLEESYTIAITSPLKRQRTRSTGYYAEQTNTFRHTLREQGTRFGDKSGSKVNFTRVIIAKIPFIVGERGFSPE